MFLTLCLLSCPQADDFSSFRPLPSMYPWTWSYDRAEYMPWDVDGDGDMDLLGRSRTSNPTASEPGNRIGYLPNDGQGNFGALQDLGAFPNAGIPEIHDINGDGIPDLVVNEQLGVVNHLYWLQGLGAGQFGPRSAPVVINAVACRFTAADLNADGILDLAAVMSGPLAIVWARGTGNGNFAPAVELPGMLSPAEVQRLFGLDYDGDGDEDLVCGHYRIRNNGSSAPTLHYWNYPMSEPFHFARVPGMSTSRELSVSSWSIRLISSSGSSYTIYQSTSGMYIRSVAPMDLDHDGYEEFVVSEFPGSCILNGGGINLFVLDEVTPNNWQRIYGMPYFGADLDLEPVDMDGDGRLDLLHRGLCNPQGAGWHRGYQINWTSYCQANFNSAGWQGQAFADGSDALADGRVVLRARFVPPGRVGYFLFSRSRGLLAPFGTGILCLSGNIYRLSNYPLTSFSSPGVGAAMRLEVPLAGLPGGLTWLPGETWHFQLWHREPNSQSNTTDGATVTFR